MRPDKRVSERCPHCQQIVMVRRRSIRGELIQALYQAYCLNAGAAGFRVSDLKGLTRGGYADFTKLKYWDLIEPVKGEERWVVTNVGKNYLLGYLRLPKYRWIFNDKVQRDPVEEPNPMISVYQIKDSGITREEVNAASITRSEFNARQNGDLFNNE